MTSPFEDEDQWFSGREALIAVGLSALLALAIYGPLFWWVMA